MFNLIHNLWIPILRQSGEHEVITPWQLTNQIQENPIIHINSPRPDFNGALIQFLIGLLQTGMGPSTEEEWRHLFRSPPSPDQMRVDFEPIAHAFHLDGDGYHFMQEHQMVGGDKRPIDSLLIEMPGENTIRLNRDHFLKRETVKGMCPPCSAMALLSLEINGPSGGRGHLTGIRGGGPLTTIVLGRNLWQTVWLNVLSDDLFLRDRFGNREKQNITDKFPWMGDARTSEAGEQLVKEDVHPTHIFWSMPRRILLNLDNLTSGTCDVCGNEGVELVTSYSTKPHGIRYRQESWRHPLTPYYRRESTDSVQMLPYHCQPGGIRYRHWLGLIQKDEDRGQEPSEVVHLFQRSRWSTIQDSLPRNPMVWAFGYDMDNMKARCWYEGSMPLIHVKESYRRPFESSVTQIVKTADYINANLRRAIIKAVYPEKSEQKNELTVASSRFWHATEDLFYSTQYDLLHTIKANGDTASVKLEWLKLANQTTQSVFEDYAQIRRIDEGDPKRIIHAYRDLRRFNSPKSKKVREILGLPQEKRRDEVDQMTSPIDVGDQ